MLLFYKKWARTIAEVILLIFTIYAIFFFVSKAFHVAAPIFIAVLIYLLLSPMLKFLRRKGIKLSLATPIAMIAFVVVLCATFITIGAVLSTQVETLSVLVPKCIEYLRGFGMGKMDSLYDKMNAIPPDIMTKIQDSASTLGTKISSFTSSFLKGLFSGITALFTNTANVIIGVIMAYLLCLESDTWKSFIENKTPNVLRESISFLRKNVLSGISKYVKAQLKLIGFSFLIVFVGLLIEKVPNAFSISVLAAIFDVLPLLGMPVIFIPWAIYAFVMGKTGFAIFLLSLLGVSMLFRQIMEPKIAGDSLGVSAFIMLSIMVISLSYFGVAGIIASPIITIILKSLYEQGYLSKWIHLPKDEFKKS